MNQQKARYFRSLALDISPTSQHTAQIITSQRTQQLFDRLPIRLPTHHMQSNSKQSRQATDNPVKRFKNSKIEVKQTSRGKSQRQSGHCVDKEEQVIDRCNIELSRIRRARQELQKQQVQSNDLLKRMKIEKQIFASIRREQQLQKEVQQQQMLKKSRIQRQKQQRDKKQLKKKLILERLHKITEQKQQRMQLLSAKSMPTIPKYKIMERVFLMQDLKRQLDRKLQGKRLHQIRYKDYLKSLHISEGDSANRNHSKKRVMTEAASQKQLTKKEQYQRKKQMIQILEEKRKQTKLKLDSQSSIKFEIMKDKTRNPQKYHFLKLKNLTDEQIYKEFQDYEIDFNSKSMGNQYLLQSKHHIKKNSPEVSIANSKVEIPQNCQLRNIKNLNELKPGRNQSNSAHSASSSRKPSGFTGKTKALDEAIRHKEQIAKILRESESKSKVMELLCEESSGNSKNIAELEKVLKQSNEYQQSMKIENCMDSEYLQFLKAKIVALGLQNL